MSEMSILHAFADEGIESEVLSAYGSVTRVGINPTDNPYTDALIQADIREWEPEDKYDVGLFHPPCQKWTPGARSNGTTGNHDNLIPRARDVAEDCCDEWIIENVPQAPLNESVRLNGAMFGLPLHYERVFELSYHVDQPRNQTRLTGGHGTFDKHHETGGWYGSNELWKSVKGYTGNYNSEALKRTAIPRPYLNYILRPLLE